VGRPELADDPRFADSAARARHNVECVEALDEIFATRTFDEWKELLLAAKGVWAPVQTAAEVMTDPQSVANGYVRDVEAASGATFQMVPSPLQFDEAPPDLTRAPEHGEHTDEVLSGLGLSLDEIIDLKIKGAVL
jgi:crotonobetainyl-CoA:carnitine CoA-transferase CaiB-like acyl-CoA transferase